jgi:hypothetical protein
MNTNELTIEQVKELISMFGAPATQRVDSGPWMVGQNYMVRTVTMTVTGRLLAVHQHELLLGEAAWIADTGRFNEFLKNPEKASEVEPFPGDAIVGRGSIVDACVITSLPRSVK